MTHLPFFVAAWLVLVGLYGVVTSRNVIHLVGCLGVIEASTYLVLLGVGWREGATAPVFVDVAPGAPTVDPVVQALMLTDVVVGATVAALALAVALQAHRRFGTLDPTGMRVMKD